MTGTGFIETRYWLLVILGVMLDFAFGALIIFMFLYGMLERFLMLLLSIALAVGIFYVSKIYYNFTKQKFFEIFYAGGRIAFKASNYALTEMQDFQKALHRAKNEYDAMK